MLKTLGKICSIGVITEPRARKPTTRCASPSICRREIRALLGRALCIRQIDAGSCNGCELEIHALGNPFYNLEGSASEFVASPRHADLLLVTGPVARNMELALKRTYEATPDPKLVVAIGDCGCTGGIFGESYASARPRRERDPGRRRGAGLPAASSADPRRISDRDRWHERRALAARTTRASSQDPLRLNSARAIS